MVKWIGAPKHCYTSGQLGIINVGSVPDAFGPKSNSSDTLELFFNIHRLYNIFVLPSELLASYISFSTVCKKSRLGIACASLACRLFWPLRAWLRRRVIFSSVPSAAVRYTSSFGYGHGLAPVLRSYPAVNMLLMSSVAQTLCPCCTGCQCIGRRPSLLLLVSGVVAMGKTQSV